MATPVPSSPLPEVPEPAPRPAQEPERLPPPTPLRPVRREAAPAAARHDLSARILGVGGLAAMIASVVAIVLTTIGSAPKPTLGPLAARAGAHAPRYWIVHSGQTLSSIASRERVSLGAVERLNPGLSPISLAAGARVRLPR
ncbi:MAG: LysM peptidoglycan-binding domain-containing protein [Solirubrobacteraceae bacterium]